MLPRWIFASFAALFGDVVLALQHCGSQRADVVDLKGFANQRKIRGEICTTELVPGGVQHESCFGMRRLNLRVPSCIAPLNLPCYKEPRRRGRSQQRTPPRDWLPRARQFQREEVLFRS